MPPSISDEDYALFASFMQRLQQGSGQSRLPQPGSSSLPFTQPLLPAALSDSPASRGPPVPPPPSQAQPFMSQAQLPLSQPGQSSTQAVASVPVTQIFQPMASSSIHSPQALGHPQPVSRQRTNFHPFLSMNLPTAQANQARMASAASTLPRSAPLPRRGRRGPAQHPPGLQAIRPRRVSAEQCFSTDMMGGQVLRLTVKVLPTPPVSISY